MLKRSDWNTIQKNSKCCVVEDFCINLLSFTLIEEHLNVPDVPKLSSSLKKVQKKYLFRFLFFLSFSLIELYAIPSSDLQLHWKQIPI